MNRESKNLKINITLKLIPPLFSMVITFNNVITINRRNDKLNSPAVPKQLTPTEVRSWSYWKDQNKKFTFKWIECFSNNNCTSLSSNNLADKCPLSGNQTDPDSTGPQHPDPGRLTWPTKDGILGKFSVWRAGMFFLLLEATSWSSQVLHRDQAYCTVYCIY